jgi:hypothetical protein
MLRQDSRWKGEQVTTSFSGGPGFLAFVVTFALVVGAILLFRSLSTHLRKVRTHPPADEAPGGAPSVGVEDDNGTRDEVADEPGDR